MRFLWFTFVLLSLTTVHTLGQEQKQWSIHAKTGFFTDRVNYPIQIEMGGNLYFKKGFSIGTGLVAYHIGEESSEYPIKYDYDNRLTGINIYGGWSYRPFTSLGINLKLGSFLGQQKVIRTISIDSNFRGGRLPDNLMVSDSNKEIDKSFFVGLQTAYEMEIMIYKDLSFLLGVQVSLYSPKYPINHNHFLIGLETGLKYNFGKSL